MLSLIWGIRLTPFTKSSHWSTCRSRSCGHSPSSSHWRRKAFGHPTQHLKCAQLPNESAVVDGVACVPKTVKNFGCRFSEDVSGYPCAYTTPGMGYEMVASPYDENYASPEAANLK